MKGMRCLRIGESLATCVLALITLLAFSLIFLFGSNHLSYAQGIGNDPQATGLILMTPEEVEAFRSTHPKVEKVLPNDIALERVNKARAKKGLPSLLGVGTVPRGKEIVSSDSRGVSGVDPLFSASLFVDNSTLPCFPVIRNQNPLGSCTTFATTYYQLTHMVGFIRTGWDNKNEDNTTKFSPRWTYNFQRDSANNGSSFWDNYNVLQNNGACTWAEFPYDGIDYRKWCDNPNAWENAINYRINPISYITDDQLVQMKETLNSGYVVTFGTYVSNWQYTRIKDNPDSTEDDAFVGKDIAYWVNGTTGGHAMTIVGYNDAIWTDVNKNRKIDTGELGAFRIANSWGASWGDSGFTWLAYDALKAISGVSGGPTSGRVPAFPEHHVYVMTLKTEYTPKMLAKFTINHAKRNQLVLHLGISDTTPPGSTPAITWYPGMFDLHGGEYAFDGTTIACDYTFVLDFTDILTSGIAQKRYYLGMFDSKTGDPATLSSFILKDKINGIEYPVVNLPTLPYNVDMGMGEVYASIDYTLYNANITNNPPIAMASALPTSGPAPLAVSFNGTGSFDPEGSSLKYIWNFGDVGSPIWAGADGITADHTYETEGIFCAKLTVTDNVGVSSSKVVFIYVGAVPGGTMHVSAIDMSLKTAGVNVNAIATVTIVDGGNPVSGATVSGQWSGATTDSDSGVTDSSGKVALQSNVFKKPPSGTTFTFTVDKVVKTGLTYDPTSNVETSDFITYPQAAPALVKVYPTNLENPYPSPGNPEMWIPFTLSDEKHVVIKIYSMAGQLVRTLDLGQKSPGAYINKDKAAYWDGKSEVGEQIASGVYFCIMKAGDFTASRKMVIAK